MKYELKYPITIPDANGKPIITNELTFGRVKSKHLELLPNEMFDGDIENNASTVRPDKMLPFIAGLAEIPEDSAREIDLVDLLAIAKDVLPSFLAEFQ